MKLKMLANFKQLQAGQIVHVDDDNLAAWLVSREYAQAVKDEPKPESYKPELTTRKRVKKAAK